MTLRPLEEVDVPAWFDRASDPESSALSGDPIPESVETCYQWLKVHEKLFLEQKGIRWAIVPDGISESIGSIGLSNISAEKRSAELGAVITRAYWNKGFGTAAAKAVIGYAFDELGLTQVRADLLQSNLASRRILEKLGFQLERELPDYAQSAAGSQGGYLYVLHENNIPAS